MNPANSAKCPTNSDNNILVISESGDAGKKYLKGSTDGWTLEGKMPAADADNYNCKAFIQLSNDLKTS